MSDFRGIGLDKKTIDVLRPITQRDTFAWIVKYIRRQQDGKAFNPHDYPWTKGICAAWDLPSVRDLSLQFAARLGKTFLANSLMISAIEHDPAKAMCAMPDEKLLKKMIRDNYYQMLDRCVKTRKLTPQNKRDRIQHRLDLLTMKMYGAWAGSPSTLADLDPVYKHGGEIDKWTKDKSSEADPFELYTERGLEIPTRKSVFESTPQVEHESRIEGLLKTGWNCRFKIPCPKCKTLIQLITGEHSHDHRRSVPGGVWFPRHKGQSEINIEEAEKLAKYECQECGKRWGDESRRQAIQKGIWLPENYEGTPTKKDFERGIVFGDGENASFQLGRLYAPTFRFGDHAKRIAECINGTKSWQNYYNSWAGETYRRRKTVLSWSIVGERLTMDYAFASVPKECIFLTTGVDVQGDRFDYVTIAWAFGGAGYIVAFDSVFSVRDLREVIFHKYEHLDGGPNIQPVMTLLDSGEGERQDEVIDLAMSFNSHYCKNSENKEQFENYSKAAPWVYPCKGSSGNIKGGWPYDKKPFSEMDDRKNKHDKRDIPGFEHVTVNTPVTQSWINQALFYKLPGQKKSLALPAGSIDDEDFLKQIVNEKIEDRIKTSGHKVPQWVVVDETVPVDFRDAVRYAGTAGNVFVRNSWNRIAKSRTVKRPPRANPVPKKKAKSKPKSKEKRYIRRGSTSTQKKKSGFLRG